MTDSIITASLPSEIAVRMRRDFDLSKVKLKELQGRFINSLKAGLSKDGNPGASIKCFQTYVQHYPTQKEKGKYLALDLGGTNFRVLLLTFDEKHFDMVPETYKIPTELMAAPAEELFDFIAECLEQFILKNNLQDMVLPLGFTFSFPCQQKGLKIGILVKWTKGFTSPGVQGEDVVSLLETALKTKPNAQNVVKIVAILNDTTGTLMSMAWLDQRTKIGLIVGTGCNACYIENVENVELFDGDRTLPTVIINCEWGNFGANGELDDILTDMDKVVDRESLNPRNQILEKCVSGMYLGELARLIINYYIDRKLLFGGISSEQFREKNCMTTKHVGEMCLDPPNEIKTAREVMNEFGLKSNDKTDYIAVRFIARCLMCRSAQLVAAFTGALVNKRGEDDTVVAVDGSVYRYYKFYQNQMCEVIAGLLDPKITKFDVDLSEDGSGRGAALVAAALTYQQQNASNTQIDSNASSASEKESC